MKLIFILFAGVLLSPLVDAADTVALGGWQPIDANGNYAEYEKEGNWVAITGTPGCASSQQNPSDATQYIVMDSTGLARLENAAHTETDFFICPGDYTSYGGDGIVSVGKSGASSGSPSTIRWWDGAGVCTGDYASDASSKPHRQSSDACRAIFDLLEFDGVANWDVQGLSAVNATDIPFEAKGDGADYILWDRMYVNIFAGRVGISITNGADNGTIQNSNIIGSVAGLDVNGHLGSRIRSSTGNGNADNNHVVNNVFTNVTDGTQVVSDDKENPGHDFNGFVFENNDVIVTESMYYNCATGVQDNNGLCSCAENGVDIKGAVDGTPGSSADWMRIIDNRLTGMRQAPTSMTQFIGGTHPCGKMGSPKAPAITLHDEEADYILIARNNIWDVENHIWCSTAGPDHISIIGEWVYDSANKGNPNYVFGLDGKCKNTEVHLNTAVSSGTMFDTTTDDTTEIFGNTVIKSSAGDTGAIGGTTTIKYTQRLDKTGAALTSDAGTDIELTVTTRVDSATYSVDDLIYADSPTACTTGSEDGCVIYVATIGGAAASSKPAGMATTVACTQTVVDGAVTWTPAYIAYTFNSTPQDGNVPTLQVFPYGLWCDASPTSPTNNLLDSDNLATTADRGVDDDTGANWVTNIGPAVTP